MDISIIIPTYKPGDYIWQCLDSIDSQTLDKDKFELLLILNGCCEPWNSQIKDWIKAHPELNIKFIQTDTPGVSNARNIGLNNATGQYITFIDDDDYISNTYLADLFEKIDCKTITLSNSISFIDKTNTFNESYAQRKCFYSLKNKDKINILHARSIFNGPCMKLIPISFIQGVSFNTSFKNGEDSLFMFEISKRIKHINIAPDSAVYFRRIRSNSASTKKKSLIKKINNIINLLTAYTKAFIKAPFSYNTIFYITRLAAVIKGNLQQN